jgi:hypothetical protein
MQGNRLINEIFKLSYPDHPLCIGIRMEFGKTGTPGSLFHILNGLLQGNL